MFLETTFLKHSLNACHVQCISLDPYPTNYKQLSHWATHFRGVLGLDNLKQDLVKGCLIILQSWSLENFSLMNPHGNFPYRTSCNRYTVIHQIITIHYSIPRVLNSTA